MISGVGKQHWSSRLPSSVWSSVPHACVAGRPALGAKDRHVLGWCATLSDPGTCCFGKIEEQLKDFKSWQ